MNSHNIAVLETRVTRCLKAPLITVEIHISAGLPAFIIVGLPEMAIKESKERVRSAIINSQFNFPAKRIIVNLAPADIPKNGTAFDLCIAIGILQASRQMPKNNLDNTECIGELALSGQIRPIRGIFSLIKQAAKKQKTLIIPEGNAKEASFCNYDNIYIASSLLEVYAHISDHKSLKKVSKHIPKYINTCKVDFSDVEGQLAAKRGMEIAAAGGHNILLFGPPGTGKTLLANCLPSILSPLTHQEALETIAIKSIAKEISYDDISLWYTRPFQAPHHSSSSVAIVGGGSIPRPGEISFAHHGVLFLDELPEFDKRVIEALREPIESGFINISRAKQQFKFPACFQLVAAMNPCPCGYLGDKQRECICSGQQIERYRRKISGPLLDRIDLHIEVNRSGIISAKSDNSETVAERVLEARKIQKNRAEQLNAKLALGQLKKYCNLTKEIDSFLENVMNKLALSKRAIHRIIKISRTIADLENSDVIKQHHVAEAINFRQFDRLNK